MTIYFSNPEENTQQPAAAPATNRDARRDAAPATEAATTAPATEAAPTAPATAPATDRDARRARRAVNYEAMAFNEQMMRREAFYFIASQLCADRFIDFHDRREIDTLDGAHDADVAVMERATGTEGRVRIHAKETDADRDARYLRERAMRLEAYAYIASCHDRADFIEFHRMWQQTRYRADYTARIADIEEAVSGFVSAPYFAAPEDPTAEAPAAATDRDAAANAAIVAAIGTEVEGTHYNGFNTLASVLSDAGDYFNGVHYFRPQDMAIIHAAFGEYAERYPHKAKAARRMAEHLTINAHYLAEYATLSDVLIRAAERLPELREQYHFAY